MNSQKSQAISNSILREDMGKGIKLQEKSLIDRMRRRNQKDNTKTQFNSQEKQGIENQNSCEFKDKFQLTQGNSSIFSTLENTNIYRCASNLNNSAT